MAPHEVAVALEAAPGRPASGTRPAAKPGSAEQLSLELALYTTFTALLRMKLAELEGPDAGGEEGTGTGSLERDLAVLEAGPEALLGTDGGSVAWQCVLYRAAQKRIVRGYLRDADAHLQGVMAQMQARVGSTKPDR